jgi:hypothetical protein
MRRRQSETGAAQACEQPHQAAALDGYSGVTKARDDPDEIDAS